MEIKNPFQCILICDIGFHEDDLRSADGFDPAQDIRTAVVKIVDHYGRVAGAEQLYDDVRTDEAGPSYDENMHPLIRTYEGVEKREKRTVARIAYECD